MIVYSRIHSTNQKNAGTPNAQDSVLIAAGKKRLVKLKFPSQGRLTGLSVFQSDGSTPVAFTVDVICSKTPFTPDQDVPVAQAPAVDLTSLKVIPTITVSTPGNQATLDDDNTGYAFRNIDGGWTLNQRFLYILINPTSAVVQTAWDIIATCISDVR